VVPAYYNATVTTAFESRRQDFLETTPARENTKDDAEVPAMRDQPGSELVPGHKRTEPQINPSEKGKLSEKDLRGGALDDRREFSLQEDARARSVVAAELSRMMTTIIATRGKLAMSASVQLLKRELSRAHELLAGKRTEANYLSIVTLVESSIGSTDLKAASAEQLRLVHRLLEIGNKEVAVTFDDYRHAARALRGYLMPASPVVDFDADSVGPPQG
jgi:hypothetical protein